MPVLHYRRRIPKMKSRQWGYDFQYEFKDMHKKEKYKYRKEQPKVVYRFDTVFFNALSFEYPGLAYNVEEILVPELGKNFYEDIKNGNPLRDDAYLWLYHLRYKANSWYDYSKQPVETQAFNSKKERLSHINLHGHH